MTGRLRYRRRVRTQAGEAPGQEAARPPRQPGEPLGELPARPAPLPPEPPAEPAGEAAPLPARWEEQTPAPAPRLEWLADIQAPLPQFTQVEVPAQAVAEDPVRALERRLRPAARRYPAIGREEGVL